MQEDYIKNKKKIDAASPGFEPRSFGRFDWWQWQWQLAAAAQSGVPKRFRPLSYETFFLL